MVSVTHTEQFSSASPPDPGPLDHGFLQRWWPAIEEEITRAVRSDQGSSPLEHMTAYQLGTGGKRLRALLPLQVTQILGGDLERTLPFAAACEMLHNASLVLDDIQDGDSMRRDCEAVWRQFGMPQGINVGIAMMYYAPRLVQRLDVPLELRERVLQETVTRTLEVIRGQSLELEVRRATPVTWDRYVEIAQAKTGGLLALPMVGAALLASAPEATVEAFDAAAQHLAVLFQVQDDVTDLWGYKGRDRVGNDILEGKPSALVAFALERLSTVDASRLLGILNQPRDRTSAEDVKKAIALLEHCGARDRALDEIIERWRAALQVFEDPTLCDFVGDLASWMTAPIVPLLDRHVPQGSGPWGMGDA